MNFDKHGQNMIKVKKRSPVTDVIGLLSFFLWLFVKFGAWRKIGNEI